MEHFYLFLRIVHIVSGAVALFSGLAALGFSLRPRKHKQIGKLFFYAMTSVFITAVILSLWGGSNFLFAIAILSFFSTFHGVRSLLFWKGAKPTWPDWLGVAFLTSVGGYLLFKGLFRVFQQLDGGVILYIGFGSLMIGLSYSAARNLKRLQPKDVLWFRSHRANMGAALIATITAFCVTALHFLPPLMAWFGPTVLLSPLLALFIKKSDAHFGLNKNNTPET